MKLSFLRVKRFRRSSAMSKKTVGFILFSIVILAFSAEVVANGDGIKFKGQVVRSSCEVRRLVDMKSLRQTQLIRVSPPVIVGLDRYRNACSGDDAAFNVSFGGAAKNDTSAVGVVIVTYQ
ncbi:hypothetical protein QN386_19875 [Pseudomonas sp. CCI3.2]|uniref:hypothetical protein n=1 Tax=unclassified Pseudomonas TaxID=196821 RepID=UPI002AC9BBFB|nr:MULTISPECIES: hypothetical protein [unclassified Pseudomonas]MEB0078795.1 hypothetical protein [Pseudomonas sp. MH10out]MEB0089700.1 hypothetical protein [Pseudomonas sp. CCI4.2]MEB0103567.1 hypothetical protein [Pseudomonas sp. CCI3.2]MEB0128989.1 hypothetical protein [Pseudomonas sp. CCI2.4]MEB0160220.1 hypothetical protein [Pseudomonas sp. AH2 (2023)]